MRDPDNAGRLQDMLQSAHEAMDLSQGRRRADLDHDRLFALAVARLLEIIGEAAARISPAFRERHPGVPWIAIIGLSNRLVHAYRDVDHDVLWQILRDDLPPLLNELQRIADSERGLV
jgi:uncharacterized protein with HEPN domain